MIQAISEMKKAYIENKQDDGQTLLNLQEENLNLKAEISQVKKQMQGMLTRQSKAEDYYTKTIQTKSGLEEQLQSYQLQLSNLQRTQAEYQEKYMQIKQNLDITEQSLNYVIQIAVKLGYTPAHQDFNNLHDYVSEVKQIVKTFAEQLSKLEQQMRKILVSYEDQLNKSHITLEQQKQIRDMVGRINLLTKEIDSRKVSSYSPFRSSSSLSLQSRISIPDSRQEKMLNKAIKILGSAIIEIYSLKSQLQRCNKFIRETDLLYKQESNAFQLILFKEKSNLHPKKSFRVITYAIITTIRLLNMIKQPTKRFYIRGLSLKICEMPNIQGKSLENTLSMIEIPETGQYTIYQYMLNAHQTFINDVKQVVNDLLEENSSLSSANQNLATKLEVIKNERDEFKDILRETALYAQQLESESQLYEYDDSVKVTQVQMYKEIETHKKALTGLTQKYNAQEHALQQYIQQISDLTLSEKLREEYIKNLELTITRLKSDLQNSEISKQNLNEFWKEREVTLLNEIESLRRLRVKPEQIPQINLYTINLFV